MSESDQLRDRLARLDPGAAASITSVDSPQGRALLEDTMNTPIDTHDADVEGRRPPSRRAGGAAEMTGSRRRGAWWLGAAAAAVVAVGIGAVALTGGDDEPELATEPSLTLSLGEGENVMASCIQPSADILAPVELAFAGTATEVDGERVVLDVTNWYAGGDAATVELTAPAGLEALIGGIDFEPGADYLVSATGGVVNYCGLSGPATPELQAIYDAAFPG